MLFNKNKYFKKENLIPIQIIQIHGFITLLYTTASMFNILTSFINKSKIFYIDR